MAKDTAVPEELISAASRTDLPLVFCLRRSKQACKEAGLGVSSEQTTDLVSSRFDSAAAIVNFLFQIYVWNSFPRFSSLFFLCFPHTVSKLSYTFLLFRSSQFSLGIETAF